MITSPLFTKADQSFTLAFPLPIRASSGFFVTGIFGKGFNHPFPYDFNERFKILRTDSSCLLLILPFSMVTNPKSPDTKIGDDLTVKLGVFLEKLFLNFAFLGKRSI
tara:strand:+ start:221 stop:541 length:321 start_codon:yes stop_codon:yes gene_type:complete